jgi:hypothetical protein
MWGTEGELGTGTRGVAGPLLDRGGMIVLAPLIAFTALLVIMVVGGRLLYPAPREPYRPEPRPQRHHVAAPATVFAGGAPVLQLQPGDAVWMTRLDNGAVVVFADSTGRELVGLAAPVPTYRQPGPGGRPGGRVEPAPGTPRAAPGGG